VQKSSIVDQTYPVLVGAVLQKNLKLSEVPSCRPWPHLNLFF